MSTTPELFETLTNTDWRGGFFSAQRAAQEMVKASIKGVIVNIASNHAEGCWPDCTGLRGHQGGPVQVHQKLRHGAGGIRDPGGMRKPGLYGHRLAQGRSHLRSRCTDASGPVRHHGGGGQPGGVFGLRQGGVHHRAPPSPATAAPCCPACRKTSLQAAGSSPGGRTSNNRAHRCAALAQTGKGNT